MKKNYVPKMPIIKRYVSYLRLSGRTLSELTCQGYGLDVERFARFIGKRSLTRATTKQIQSFVAYLLGECNLARVSVSRKVVSLHSFYKYLKLEGIRSDDPAADIQPPRFDKRLPVVLDKEEVERLLATRVQREGSTAKRTDRHIARDLAIIALYCASGVRCMELATMRAHDVNFEKMNVKVFGKYRKERIVFFNESAAKAMLAYLQLRQQDGDYAFFLSRDGKQMSLAQISNIVKEVAGLSGVTRATSHVIRHSFATHLLEDGADLPTIQALLGHQSLATTGIYVNVSPEHMRRKYDEAQAARKAIDAAPEL